MIYTKTWKRDPKGFVIQSDITKMFYNGYLKKVLKFKVHMTLSGKQYYVFFKNNNKVYQSLYDDIKFKKHFGDNLKLCRYFLKEAPMNLAYKHMRAVAKRYLAKFYPEELI